MRRFFLIISLLLTLSACDSAYRLATIGGEPPMTRIQNPVSRHDYRPVTTPIPAPIIAKHEPNSLWRTGARAFFKDQRAQRVGDILTVVVEIADNAKVESSSDRKRKNAEKLGGTFLGYEQSLDKVLPEAVNNAGGDIVDLGSESDTAGDGTIDRKETVNVKIPAVVIQELPNGNLVINGKQEIRINYELRDISVVGIIRPEDITSLNTIPYEKIAEARISYGGRGLISDIQKPRYGQELFDIISPF